MSRLPNPPSAVTRRIILGTIAAIAIVATLSVVTYRSAVSEAVTSHSNQQLAMVRTAAVAIEGEIHAQTVRLRQFNSLPSVQNLDLDVLSQRVEAAFGDVRREHFLGEGPWQISHWSGKYRRTPSADASASSAAW